MMNVCAVCTLKLLPSLFLQIENMLMSTQGTIKLCDFGSATTLAHYPDYSWSAQKRAMVEEEVRSSRFAVGFLTFYRPL